MAMKFCVLLTALVGAALPLDAARVYNGSYVCHAHKRWDVCRRRYTVHLCYGYRQPERSVRSNRYQSGWIHVHDCCRRLHRLLGPGYQFFIPGVTSIPQHCGRRWNQPFHSVVVETSICIPVITALGPGRKTDHRHQRSRRASLWRLAGTFKTNPTAHGLVPVGLRAAFCNSSRRGNPADGSRGHVLSEQYRWLYGDDRRRRPPFRNRR